MPKIKVYMAMSVHRFLRAKIFNLARTMERYSGPDAEFEFQVLDGDALIARSRSRLATHFLMNRKDCDVMLFLDDDIVYAPGDIIRMVRGMVREKLGVVCAPYVTKDPLKPSWTFRPLADTAPIPFGEKGGFVEIEYGATGCMAISRLVLQDIVKQGKLHLCKDINNKFYPFFDTMESQDYDGVWEYLSEDWAFCLRAREAGHKIYLDSTVKLKHIGEKEYSWDDLPRANKLEPLVCTFIR